MLVCVFVCVSLFACVLRAGSGCLGFGGDGGDDVSVGFCVCFPSVPVV